MEGVENLVTLQKLELYDNHIEEINCINQLSNLRILDLSFNAIREMIKFAEYVPLLEELYIAQNKLRKIEGLQGLVHLRVLDLGANRIRVSSQHPSRYYFILTHHALSSYYSVGD